MKKTLLLILLSVLLGGKAMAVIAYPELVKFVQPDKRTSVMLYLKGDERVHWAETVDGYSLVTDDNGYFVYATKDAMGNMVPSEFVATDVENRSQQVTRFLENTPKHLAFSKMQIETMLSMWEVKNNLSTKGEKTTALTGDRKILVIMMGFQDRRFSMLRSMVRAMFNQVNYSTVGAYGSVHDYYYENSYGQLNLTADVVGPFVCDSNASYYGRNDNQSVGYQAFATEAITAAAPHVDFSDYDNDGDGVLDCVHILYAGYGEEAGGGADCIWAHKWSFFDPPTYNNTRIETYSCSPELSGNSGQVITRIGVVCHEIGHVFGAPDFYDTDYGESGGQYPATGNWDLMASGSWNHGGATPAHHNPYTKSHIYKWCKVKTISSPSCITLQPASTDSASFYRLNTPTQGEYYLIENRQQIGFDASLPSHGMLVYHAHSSLGQGGPINTTHPQKFFIVSAGSTALYPTGSAASYAGVNTPDCPFPGATHHHILNDTTRPSLLSWNHDTSGHHLTYIGENIYNHTISFVYNNGCVPISSAFSGEGVSGDKVQLTWTPFGSQNVMIVVNDTDNFSTPQNRRYTVGDTMPTGERVVVTDLYDIHALCTNLLPNTLYYFRLYTMLSDSTYSQPLATTATTLCANESFPFSCDFQTGHIPECWISDSTSSLSWQLEREGYNLFMTMHGDSTTQNGATTTMQMSPVNLGTNTNLVLLLDVRNPMRYETLADSTQIPILDTLVVKYRTASMYEWATLRVFSNNIPTWQHFSIPLPNISDDYRIAFEGHWGGKTLSLDKIKISGVHLITVTTDGNGTVQPGGGTYNNVSVPDGESVTFTITPNEGYTLSEIYLDYELQQRVTPFVLNNVTQPHVLYFTFEPEVGIAQANDDRHITLTPNPASGKVRISLSENSNNAQYTIYGISGRVVSQGTVQNGTATEVDMSACASGIYFVKVVGDTFKTTEKLIIKR